MRPTAIYANPVLLDLIDREMKAEYNVVLNTDQITGCLLYTSVRRGVRPGDVAFAERKLRALRRMLEEPNAVDSFRTLMEQVIEDALTGGYGAIEMEPTGDAERPAMLWPVDGASILSLIHISSEANPDKSCLRG